ARNISSRTYHKTAEPRGELLTTPPRLAVSPRQVYQYIATSSCFMHREMKKLLSPASGCGNNSADAFPNDANIAREPNLFLLFQQKKKIKKTSIRFYCQ